MRRLLPMAALLTAALAAQGAPLRCELQGPAAVSAGDTVRLQFALTNTGADPLWVLRWNTPWEGRWLAPFVELSRDGQPLDYQGAMVKRARPDAAAYLRLSAGETLRATVALAPAFDVGRPGRYLVQPRLELGDVQAQAGAAPPRLGAEWSGQVLECAPLSVEVRARR